MGGGTVTRRDFIKTSGVGAAVATGLGDNLIGPGRANAAKKKLRIVQWVHFVPAYDEWFNKKYAVEWGQQNDTDVTVDNIGIAGINARAAAEVSAQKGHEIGRASCKERVGMRVGARRVAIGHEQRR